MEYQMNRESRPSNDSIGVIQRLSSDFTETQLEQTTRDSLPKYYPRDHEVTRWLVNQMRCRNGLHHLVNLANVQPSLLSAYFELYDQPHLYIDARTGPGMPAYSIKTVLYLTPLAIAIYFRLRSVLRLLLDASGTRIHARARQEIDVNATCYVRRTKPRPGPFVMDEYSTTYPAVIAVRREFFTGLTLLMAANFHPQAPVGIIERLGTTRETTFWYVDLLDFCVKLLNTRPGLDVIGLLQTICYRTLSESTSAGSCYYDPCVYDVRLLTNEFEEDSVTEETWCSVFHRVVRKGASRSYSNCGNRLIGLLEHVTATGFFRQKYMPKGPVAYGSETNNRRGNKLISARKMNSEMIMRLDGHSRDTARQCIAADRDSCLCLLTLWLERVRNRCLDRQAQRLFRLLTTALSETDLLNDFLYPPDDIDLNVVLHPYWLVIGLSRMAPKQLMNFQTMNPIDFLDDDANEVCELEPPQVNEIRHEVGILGHALGLVDYSDKLYNFGCPRLVEIMSPGGAVGDAENNTRDQNEMIDDSRVRFESKPMTPEIMELPRNRCASEEIDRQGGQSRSSVGLNIIPTSVLRKADNNNSRLFWSSPNRNLSSSPPAIQMRRAIKIPEHNENKNNTISEIKCNMAAGEMPKEETENSILKIGNRVDEIGSKSGKTKRTVIKKATSESSTEKKGLTQSSPLKSGVWRGKRIGKSKPV